VCPDLDGARFAEDDEPQSYPTRTAVVVFRVDANLPLVPVDVPCGSDVIFLAHALGCRVAVDLEQLHRGTERAASVIFVMAVAGFMAKAVAE